MYNNEYSILLALSFRDCFDEMGIRIKITNEIKTNKAILFKKIIINLPAAGRIASSS